MGEKLGFIGLGKMGLPLSRNLMEDGHEMSGYDIDQERGALLEDAGGYPAESALEVAERSDIVFTMLLQPKPYDLSTRT